jgi:hypothetical protein
MNYFDQNVVYTQFTQKLIEIGASSMVSDMPGVAESLKLDIYRNAFEHAVMSLRAYVVGDSTETNCEFVRYPKTWWDAFKAQYFSDRFLKKWPAEYVERRIATQTITRICPHLSVRRDQPHVQFLMYQGPQI